MVFCPVFVFSSLILPDPGVAMTKFVFRSSLCALSIMPTLLLAACGGDLEPAPYEGVPYTQERTAGRGVQYVRASMLPPRETNTQMMQQPPVAPAPAQAAPPPPVEAPAPATAGDKMFESKQAK